MIVIEHKAYFHNFSRHAMASISIEAGRIIKFVKGLITSLQLTIAQLVTIGVSFQSIMDYAKKIESIF